MLDLGKIRDEIDATDDEIVRLFQHRMALTAEVAQYKIVGTQRQRTSREWKNRCKRGSFMRGKTLMYKANA